MDEQLAKKMDDVLVGPRLFCEYCRESRVLSPCYLCHGIQQGLISTKFSSSPVDQSRVSRDWCRGCGLVWRFSISFYPCQKKYEICKISRKERVLQEISQIFAKQKKEAHFLSYQLEKLPAQIGELTSLKILDIDNNELKKLPEEIGQLTNLQELHLSYNQLRELPKEIGQLVNLQKLYLDGNQLRETPKEIKQLTKLHFLTISDNNLSGSQMQELKKALPNCRIHF